jgi:hypothetical protein
MASGESGDGTLASPHVLRLPSAMSVIRAPGRALRWIWKNLDLAVLAILCLAAVIGFLWGSALRPTGGAPTIPSSQAHVAIDLAPGSLRGLGIDSDLVQENGSRAELKIDATATAADHTMISFGIEVGGFTGTVCRVIPYRGRSSVARRGGAYVIAGASRLPANSIQPFLVVDLCWAEDPPVVTSDAYFGAVLPRILVPSQAGTLTNGLELAGTSLARYSPSGGLAPTDVGPQLWTWTSALSGSDFGSPGSNAMVVLGTSASEIQRENDNAFYAGILFGIAGGAAMSLVVAVPGVVNDRRKKSDASSESVESNDA